jgi:hypothetical protein
MTKTTISYALLLLLIGCSSLNKSKDPNSQPSPSDRSPIKLHPVNKTSCFTFGQLRKELKMQVEQLEQQKLKKDADAKEIDDTIKVNNVVIQSYDWLCNNEIAETTTTTPSPITCIYGSVFRPRVAQIDFSGKKVIFQGNAYTFAERPPEPKIDGQLYSTIDDSNQFLINKNGFQVKDHGYPGNKYKFVDATCYQSNQN